jgi:nuclear RNA export factor
MQTFLAKFIQEFYRLFDTHGRGELYACYHDSCMLSLCITTIENSIVPIRQYRYGPLIYESRNLQKIVDDNRRCSLLRHGKTAVLDFLRVKFPLTKHDGNSFRVDVISTSNNRAVFTVNGLYKEVDQSTNSPVRCFQRTFTCAQTPAGVLIIADHILLSNATEAQILNLTHHPSTTSSQTTNTQSSSNTNADIQNQLIYQFSQESGMNIEYSKLCLQENHWDYNKAAEVFIDLRNKNQIPSEAFNKS